MTLPAWTAALAGLDDDALAALANPGLVRRAHRLAPEVELVEASADEVVLGVSGFEVRLLPGGPKAARCPCPVAGVCVHLVAGCLWARDAVGQAASGGPAPGTPDVLAEVLGWEPTTVNRAVGLAAVRTVARGPEPSGPLTVRTTGAHLAVSWPGSPTVIVVAGAGPAGMLVDGNPPETAARAWMLETVIRLFAERGRAWEWPDGVLAGDLQPDQREAAALVIEVVERLVAEGVSQADRAGIDRLSRAGQRARLEDLPLLSRLVATAAGLLDRLSNRVDEVEFTTVLSALAQAWAAALAVQAGHTNPGMQADAVPQRLVPLAVRWWHSPSGARGLTLHAWDPDGGCLEQATNGRAAGADPGFTRSWTAPLLWGASAERLSSGVLGLTGARRRDDGTLSASTKTTVSAGAWTDVDLPALAEQVNSAGSGDARTRFGAATEPLRIVQPRPRFGLGVLELDEVAQELVWPVTDRSGTAHRLALPALEDTVLLLTWLVEEARLLALVCVGDRPEAAFLSAKGGLELVSLTLSPLPRRRIEPSWRRRLLKLDQQRRATPTRRLGDLERVCAALAEVLDNQASGGIRELSPRQRDSLIQRGRELDDLGLGTLGRATAAFLDAPTPAALLWARLVLDRVEALLA